MTYIVVERPPLTVGRMKQMIRDLPDDMLILSQRYSDMGTSDASFVRAVDRGGWYEDLGEHREEQGEFKALYIG